MGAVRVRALEALDVDVQRGEFLILQGPSGSGKTTLINLLGLLDRPDAGSLLLDGRSVGEMDENARADLRRDRFGFVFQTFNLVPVLTALENVEYPLGLRREPRAAMRARAQAVLARVGLTGREELRPDLLSGGERQRVALARAVVHEPEVVFADEPTAHLDSQATASVLELMQELCDERHVAFVVATHDPRVVARGHRVLTLRDGRTVVDS